MEGYNKVKEGIHLELSEVKVSNFLILSSYNCNLNAKVPQYFLWFSVSPVI